MTFTPQFLTAKEVAQGCLDNWDRLGATTKKNSCRYIYDDGCGCAIGINLDETVKIEIKKSMITRKNYNFISISGLKILGFINYIDKDKNDLLKLQAYHDQACSTKINDIIRLDRIANFRMFCEMLANGEIK